MNKHNLITPEGTRDLLFDESIARRTVEEKLTTLFKNNGFSEVITPGIEFIDVLGGHLSEESMYKCTDFKGRLIAIRPDSTMAIARLVSTRLSGEALPLKLFYNQNIFRVNPKNSGRDDEVTQCGLEIIGGETEKSDLQLLYLAAEVLKICSQSQYVLEIGNNALFKHLVSEIGMDDNDIECVRSFIEAKNYPELVKKLSPYGESDNINKLKILPTLFGNKDTFAKAKAIFTDEFSIKIISSLENAFNFLEELGFGDHISVDLGLVNKLNYYTGISFMGYVNNYGKSIIDGGRYDNLIVNNGNYIPATGFAVNVNATAELLKNTILPKDASTLIFSEDGFMTKSISYMNSLIKAGQTANLIPLSTLDEAISYAKSKQIAELSVVGNEIKTVVI